VAVPGSGGATAGMPRHYDLLTLVLPQHGNTLRIENTGSISWKPLRCSSGPARDDDDDDYLSNGYASCHEIMAFHDTKINNGYHPLFIKLF